MKTLLITTALLIALSVPVKAQDMTPSEQAQVEQANGGQHMDTYQASEVGAWNNQADHYQPAQPQDLYGSYGSVPQQTPDNNQPASHGY